MPALRAIDGGRPRHRRGDAARVLNIVFSPDYVAPLPVGHRFPMNKFRLLAELLQAQGLADAASMHVPTPVTAGQLCLAHTPEYVEGVLGGHLDARLQRRIGFPVDAAVVRRSLAAVGGTLLAARLACRVGRAFNTAGGSHHAFADRGGGFCVFNDVAVAARVLLEEGSVRRVLVVDLDVHQGDGTAAISAGDERIFTFSMHCADNYPARKQTSDLDVPLAAGTGDDAYLRALEPALREASDRQRPDLVFYNAGVDPHRDDRLGLLSLSDQGLRAREDMVLGHFARLQVPLVGVVGGGYGEDVHAVVARHALLHHAAARL